MWEPLRAWLQRFWTQSQSTVTDRRTVRARDRFWAEVREGEREAEQQAGS
jgi:hypothetical protein